MIKIKGETNLQNNFNINKKALRKGWRGLNKKSWMGLRIKATTLFGVKFLNVERSFVEVLHGDDSNVSKSGININNVV